jgi:hypothetical protein
MPVDLRIQLLSVSDASRFYGRESEVAGDAGEALGDARDLLGDSATAGPTAPRRASSS